MHVRVYVCTCIQTHSHARARTRARTHARTIARATVLGATYTYLSDQAASITLSIAHKVRQYVAADSATAHRAPYRAPWQTTDGRRHGP
jgi:hypothetical protein